MNHDEANLQTAVVAYLQAVLPKDAAFWATMNERQTTPQAGKRANRMGRKAGVADLLILWRGRLHAIELKLPTRRDKPATYQSAAQKEWQTDMEAAGGFYAVCRSIDDVQGMLRAWSFPIKGPSGLYPKRHGPAR